MKKGVVLVIVIGVLFVIFTLALTVLYLMTQESRIAEHKIRRSKAHFAAQAGIVDAFEQLRKGTKPLPTIGTPTTYSFAVEVNKRKPDIIIVAKGDLAASYNGATYPCAATIPSDHCIFVKVEH